MITNRELSMDDYLAMLRRRGKWILVPALLGLAVGYGVYVPVKKLAGKYTSQSIVLVEGQKVPENMVQPVVSDDLQERIGRLRAEATSDSVMRPLLQNLYPNRGAGEIDGILEDMRSQPSLIGTPFADLSQLTGSTVKKKPGQTESPGFMVSYTASDPRMARDVCEALTSAIIRKNLEFIQASAKGTVDVLNTGIEDAKSRLNQADQNLAKFRAQNRGKLPTDQDSNMKALMSLTAQQDHYTQQLSLAQQDKSYNQTQLSQQVAAWKSSQSMTNPQTLQKQLSDLQTQLVDLEARYTADHPDVIKTKADISELKRKLAEINKASAQANDGGTDTASAMEPVEIRQLRQQIHHDDALISDAERELARIRQDMSHTNQTLSPDSEGQYEQFIREYDNAAKAYQDLLATKNKADLTANMTSLAQGEQMREIQPANLPDSPSFPQIPYFILGGLAGGLALGCGLALWLELRDNSIRTEADAEAALELPMLVAVPWVGAGGSENGNGKFWHWKKKGNEVEKQPISV